MDKDHLSIDNEDLQRLETKVDRLTSIMENVLEKLSTVTIIAKQPVIPEEEAKKIKRDIFEEHINKEMFARGHRHQLQNQFNLLVPPSTDRIIRYLNSKDPKVFDGLKRNGEQAPGYGKGRPR